jgi:hypothetical protein
MESGHPGGATGCALGRLCMAFKNSRENDRTAVALACRLPRAGPGR